MVASADGAACAVAGVIDGASLRAGDAGGIRHRYLRLDQVHGQRLGVGVAQAEVRHARAGLERRRVLDPRGHVVGRRRPEPGAEQRAAPEVGEIGTERAGRHATDRVAADARAGARRAPCRPTASPVGSGAGAFCPATQRSNAAGSSTITRSCMLAWQAPQNSAHWPQYSPTRSGVSTIRLTRPGTTSRLPPSCGTQKLWITSGPSRSRTIGRPTGRCSSLAVTTSSVG